ncbi:MAG: hypothetical protein ABIS51_12425 [Sphingomonas sp.]
MKIIHSGIAIAAIMLGGPVAAQSAPQAGPPPGPAFSAPVGGSGNPTEGISLEEQRLTRLAQDDALNRERYTGSDRARDTRKLKAVAAKPSDVTVGSKVADIKGIPVGTIESVDADGAVVVTETGKVKLGLDTLGKNQDGLLVSVTKAQFDAAVQAAVAKP